VTRHVGLISESVGDGIGIPSYGACRAARHAFTGVLLMGAA